jgi:cell wall-associated NlpC family hydrolase
MVQKYLSLKHEYGKVDCIELIRSFYLNELGISFDLPSYPASRDWMKKFSTIRIDEWASSYATKVELTEAKNYDVMVFKSDRSNLVIHFGLYLMPSRMLHIEEGGFSCVQNLSDYWVSRLHTIFRHNDMV